MVALSTSFIYFSIDLLLWLLVGKEVRLPALLAFTALVYHLLQVLLLDADVIHRRLILKA